MACNLDAKRLYEYLERNRMITLHSIDLKYVRDPCFAAISVRGTSGCRLLHKTPKRCDYRCPFYKPKECRDWVRVEEGHDISIVPPEEYRKYRRRQYEQRTGVRK